MKIEFECEEIDINAIKGDTYPIFRISGYSVGEESLMENLNFEDVMNYYGVSKVGEWAEANR